MKKITLFIILTLLPAWSFAQEKHLEFKGIPIDGQLTEFVEKLKNEGYTLVQQEWFVAQLEGKFANKDCNIYVLATPKTNIVESVVVHLPQSTSWQTIQSDYYSYKEIFTNKYGAPYDSYEFFSNPYNEGDGYEMQAIREEKCHYISFWGVPEGTIYVQISGYEQITFTYEDKINSEKSSEEKQEAVMDDI